MPFGLYAESADKVEVREYVDAPLGDRQYRLRVTLATPKHGTESHTFDERSPAAKRRFDKSLRLFVPREEGPARPPGGKFVGNMVVGTVSQTGAAVTRFRVGDRVYAHGPICETVTLDEPDGKPLLPPLTECDAVCQDPALFALAAVRDARICLGDNVVLFGLGAIGLLVVQMLRAGGCLNIAAVDPVPARRRLAEQFGAQRTFDPRAVDVALELRRWWGQGADKAIEASGNYAALREAIRCARNCARVVLVGYYKGADTGLELGADFYHNRLDLVVSLPAWDNPLREAPLWDQARLATCVAEMFGRGLLQAQEIVAPVVSLAAAPDAYREALRNPASAVKLGVRFA